MAITKILTKEQAASVINDVPFRYPVDIDYLYEIYETANEAIQMLNRHFYIFLPNILEKIIK